MGKLDRSSLWSLEAYAEIRPGFRAEVMAHEKPRRVALSPHATLIFEDALTMKYQVQEMLRVERIFEAPEIDAELETYNPLIPDGGNLKVTLMIEYPDVAQRREALAGLKGVEHDVWLQAEGQAKIKAIANEDLERSNSEKTAAVHFLRFELDPPSIRAFKTGAAVTMGVSHIALDTRVILTQAQQESLAEDLL